MESASQESVTIHYIQVDENHNFIWIRSLGPLETLHKYIKRNAQPKEKITIYSNFEEKQFYEHNERIVIIADEPGMGKSTTLTSLSTQLKSSWIIRVNLKDCSAAIAALDVANLDIDRAIDFFTIVEPDILGKSLTIKLLKLAVMGMSSKRIYIFFDGFDEIKEEEIKEKYNETIVRKRQGTTLNAKDKVIHLLKFFQKKTKAYIVVTTREHTRNILENNLSKFATVFKRIEKSDQIKFLMNFWEKWLILKMNKFENDEIKMTVKYTENLLDDASKIFGNEISNFIGVPLQLRMLAEIFSPKLDSITSATNNYDMGNIGDIYAKYIERKFDIYLQEKVQLLISPTNGFKTLLNESFETVL